MKLMTYTCPNCNASIDVNLDNEKRMTCCPYCGSKISIDYDNTTKIEYVYRDEARIEGIKARQLANKQYKEEKESIYKYSIKELAIRIIKKNLSDILKTIAIFILIAFMILLPMIFERIESHNTNKSTVTTHFYQCFM